MGSSTATPRAFHGHVESTAVLKLTGPIRFVAAQAIRHFVDDLPSADPDDGVLIDLRAVDVIDSTGMGVLARIGRTSLERRGRRAVIVCPQNDVATTLRSASFDEVFVMLETCPYDDEDAELAEVPLVVRPASSPELDLGRVVLDAHRELVGVSERNMDAYRDVIVALEAELLRPRR
jgi:anti-anti-sigma factor